MAAVPSFAIFFICLHSVIHGMTETTVLIIAKRMQAVKVRTAMHTAS